MLRRILRFTRADRGNVLVTVGVLLTSLIGMSALTVDATAAFATKRELRNAADAAALAAAYELAREGTIASATAAAESWAAANGYPTPIVNIPPINGPFAGNPRYVEVILRTASPVAFGQIFGIDHVDIGARAVAEGFRSALPYSFLVMNPTECSAFKKSSSGSVQVAGTIYVNSDCSTDAMSVGGGGTVSAGDISVVGGYTISGGSAVIPTPTTGVDPIPDPLIGIPPPDLTTLTLRSNHQLVIAGGGNRTLRPGIYEGGIDVSNDGTVTLEPGIYVLKGGGMHIRASSRVVGNGVMIYNTCGNGDCSIPHNPSEEAGDIIHDGFGTFSLTAMTSGVYQGLLLFQDRAATSRIRLEGNGDYSWRGTVYAASGSLSLAGNDGSSALQVFVDTLDVTGNGDIIANYDDAAFVQLPRMRLVE